VEGRGALMCTFTDQVYLPEGVRFQLALPEGEREAFLKALQDATRGRVVEG